MRDDKQGWTVDFVPRPTRTSGHSCNGVVTLRFDGRLVREEPIAFVWEESRWIPNEGKAAYFRAAVESFTRNHWEPSGGGLVMEAARILQDALSGHNGRRIAHVRRYRGGVSVTVHPCCSYRFTQEGEPISYDSAERGVAMELSAEEREKFKDLVDGRRLMDVIADDLADKDEREERGSNRKDKVTAREKKLKALQEKLAAWNEGKPIKGKAE